MKASDKKTAASTRKSRYALQLFVAGATDRSREAVLHVRELCAGRLKGRCTLEVIDIYQQPGLARTHQIIATPTLIIQSPPPRRQFIGSVGISRAVLQVGLN